MSDEKASPYEQVQLVLRTVLTHPAFVNGSGPFTRTLHVTDAIKDVRVSPLVVEVHPEWAVERGPIDAVKQIKQLCLEFDARREGARLRREAELRRRLREVVEDIRRSAHEDLIHEVHSLPVPRSRSLVKHAYSHLPVPKHRALVRCV